MLTHVDSENKNVTCPITLTFSEGREVGENKIMNLEKFYPLVKLLGKSLSQNGTSIKLCNLQLAKQIVRANKARAF